MSALSILRQLRHGSLKKFDKVWLFLGKIYRFFITRWKPGFACSHYIGKYGPFQLDAYFSFSDFKNWGAGHNRGFEMCVQACENKKCVIDIGAHIGLVSLPVSRLIHREGSIYAIEPAKANRVYLERHVDLNKRNNIQIYDLLIGDTDMENQIFFEQKAVSGMNSLVKNKKTIDGSYEKTHKKQMTLDSFCEKYALRPDLIKIDIEGAEILALKGARKTLHHYRPTLFLSVHPAHIAQLGQDVNELHELIRDYGYVVQDVNGRQVEHFKLDEYILMPKERVHA